MQQPNYRSNPDLLSGSLGCAHVRALRLAVHKHIEAQLLLDVDRVAHVLVDALLVRGAVDLAVAQRLARLPQGCVERQVSLSVIAADMTCTAMHRIVYVHMLTYVRASHRWQVRSDIPGVPERVRDKTPGAQSVVFTAQLLKRDCRRRCHRGSDQLLRGEQKGVAYRRGTPLVWGKEPMVVVGKGGMATCFGRRVAKSSLRANIDSSSFSASSPARRGDLVRSGLERGTRLRLGNQGKYCVHESMRKAWVMQQHTAEVTQL